MKFVLLAYTATFVSCAAASSVYAPEGVVVTRDAIRLETIGEIVWQNDFSNSGNEWKIHNNYENQVEISFGREHRGSRGLVVRGFKTNKVDSAWSVRMNPEKLPKKGPSYILTFELSPDVDVPDYGCDTELHRSAILWFDAAGKRLAAERIPFSVPAGDYERVRMSGPIPAGAEAFAIQIGFDGPNLWGGNAVAYRNLKLAVEGETPQYVRKGRFITEYLPKGALNCRAEKPAGTSVSLRPVEEDKATGFCRCDVTLTSDGRTTPELKTVTVGKHLLLEWTRRPDDLPPRVRNAFDSPTTNRFVRPVFDVTDASVVVHTPFAVSLDGKDATAQFEWLGDRLVAKPRAEPWQDGLHTCDVTVADIHGNRVTAKKRFFIGETGKTPKVTLRDDGVALIDGEPFFPIGMYGVMRREFNDHDFNKAFDGLAAGGFNVSHSYSETFDQAYLDACAKHGFMKLQFARLPDHRMVTASRFDPTVLAWYLGDDTSRCEKPWELWDYEDAVKAVDPNRLTCQADVVGASAEVSAYRDYVTGTDVFLPEIYPMSKDTLEDNRLCAAKAILDMKRIAADVEEARDNRVHAAWPIIQYFQGWGWKHFPTKAELHAMTFAAICHGAKGMTWYAYCGVVDPEKKKFNYGVTSSPERWANICELATRLKALSPVLVERTPPQPAKPEIMMGPTADAVGNDSISFLFKNHGDDAYLFAVNSAAEPVEAKFKLNAGGNVDVLYENRTLRIEGGELVDRFEPLAVHLYRFKSEWASLPPVGRLQVRDHAPLKLVENGNCQFAIVADFKAEAAFRGPENRTLMKFNRDSIRRGAIALRRFFKETTGTEPAMLDVSDKKTGAFNYVIALGKTPYSEALGLKPETYPREGFEVRTFEKGVVIVGMDGFTIPGVFDIFSWHSARQRCNGTENGAMDFAERFLGVRTYSRLDDGLWNVRPKISALTVTPIAYRDYPRFNLRGNPAFNWRLGASTDIFCTEAPNPFDFAKAHPDKLKDLFYRDADGVLWQSDTVYGANYFDVTNPKLAETLVDDWKRYYAQNGTNTYWGECWSPSSRCVFFGQVDAYRVLNNDRAKPYVDPDAPQDMSDVYTAFHTDLANRVAKEFPGKRIVLMAYMNFLNPPKKFDKLPDNVQMLVCNGSPLFSRCPAYRDFLFDTLDSWTARTTFKPSLYVYDAGFANDAVLVQTMRGYFDGEFFRMIRDRIDNEFLFPCFSSLTEKYTWCYYPSCLAMWNPDTDVDAVLEEYYRLMFGEKAGVRLRNFTYRILDRWIGSYVREAENVRGSIPGPDYRILYTKTFPESVVKELLAELDTVEAMLPEGSPERRRFDKFANPYRGIFPDVIAYQHISFPDITVARRTAPVVIDGKPDEAAWKKSTVPPFQRSFAGGKARSPTPTVHILWDNHGLYLSIESPAPIKVAEDMWKGDSVELFFTRGDSSPHLYQFVLAASGAYEDYYKQLDPPRIQDPNWKAEGATYVAKCGEGGWRGECFVPWSAIQERAPKTGDVWKMNIISSRALPVWEDQSVSPTLQNNRRVEMYSKMVFGE